MVAVAVQSHPERYSYRNGSSQERQALRVRDASPQPARARRFCILLVLAPTFPPPPSWYALRSCSRTMR